MPRPLAAPLCCALALAFALPGRAQDQEPERKPELELQQVGELESPAGVPVVFSADGKTLVYVRAERSDPDPQTGEQKRSFIYARAAADGSGMTELFETPVAWDDMLVVFVAPGVISPDGKRVAAVTSVEGKSYKEGYLLPLVLDADGTKTPVASSLGATLGFGFAGERLLVLEGKPEWRRKGGEGYRLEAWQGGKSETLHADEAAQAFGLRVSPDGNRVAFLMADAKDRRKARARVIDLGTRKAIDSEAFRTDDYTFDGPPFLLWSEDGKGVYYNASTGDSGKRPFGLYRLDVETGKTARVVEQDNVGLTAVLGKGLLAVHLNEEGFRGAAVLRLADGKLFRLEPRSFIVGGHGRRLAVYRKVAGKGAICQIVDFTLPK